MICTEDLTIKNMENKEAIRRIINTVRLYDAGDMSAESAEANLNNIIEEHHKGKLKSMVSSSNVIERNCRNCDDPVPPIYDVTCPSCFCDL